MKFVTIGRITFECLASPALVFPSELVHKRNISIPNATRVLPNFLQPRSQDISFLWGGEGRQTLGTSLNFRVFG